MFPPSDSTQDTTSNPESEASIINRSYENLKNVVRGLASTIVLLISIMLVLLLHGKIVKCCRKYVLKTPRRPRRRARYRDGMDGIQLEVISHEIEMPAGSNQNE